MATIAHPDGEGRIEVELIDEETHGGATVRQIASAEDGVELSDPSGENPWVHDSDVEGL